MPGVVIEVFTNSYRPDCLRLGHLRGRYHNLQFHLSFLQKQLKIKTVSHPQYKAQNVSKVKRIFFKLFQRTTLITELPNFDQVAFILYNNRFKCGMHSMHLSSHTYLPGRFKFSGTYYLAGNIAKSACLMHRKFTHNKLHNSLRRVSNTRNAVICQAMAYKQIYVVKSPS